MATITTRSGKGSALTHTELDNNFTNLNTDKVEASGDTITGNLDFNDNVKARFGAGQDLQIYHDGSNSLIKDVGSGDLNISAGNDLRLQDSSGNNYFKAGEGGASKVYYAGAEKLATTSTGIDVTGSVALSGDITSTDTINIAPNGFGKGVNLKRGNGAVNGLSLSSGGDISFYNSAGTSQSFFWDSSAESLGIGTSSPQQLLTIGNHSTVATSGNMGIRTTSSGHAISIIENGTAGTGTDESWQLGVNSSGDLGFFNSSSSTASVTFLDSNNNVGIGTSSPSANLHVSSSGDAIARITSADGNGAFLDLGDASDPDGGRIVYDSGSNLGFSTASTERMRIDSSGKVGINDSDPDQALTVNGTIQAKNNSATDIAAGASGTVITPPRGYSYINVSHSGTASHGLLLLVFRTSIALTIVSTIDDRSNQYSASVSGTGLVITNTGSSTKTFYASCVCIAFGLGD